MSQNIKHERSKMQIETEKTDSTPEVETGQVPAMSSSGVSSILDRAGPDFPYELPF